MKRIRSLVFRDVGHDEMVRDRVDCWVRFSWLVFRGAWDLGIAKRALYSPPVSKAWTNCLERDWTSAIVWKGLPYTLVLTTGNLGGYLLYNLGYDKP
jgi:hypothetical protein